MPKILRIINRLNLGGPTYNVSYLIKYLSPKYETLLVSGSIDSTEASSLPILDKMNIKPLIVEEMKREVNPVQDRIAYKKIAKIIKDFNPDIVHTHAAKAGAIGRLAASYCNVPVIVHTFHGHVFHSYFSRIMTKVFIKMERYLAKRSSKIIALSPILRNDLIRYRICEESKIEVIPLGFDLTRFQENMETKRKIFREKWGLRDDDIAICIVGRIVPIKNHELFLQAFDRVTKKTKKRIKAFIVGDGEDKIKVQSIADSLKMEYSSQDSPLIFTSWVNEIDCLLAGMDIVTLTSNNEGTPVSLIEAQAANKAIVSTNVGGVEDTVISGKTALLSGVRDVERFSGNVLKLVEDDNLRKTMSDQGWQHVQQKFHYMRLVNDFDKLYERLLER